MIAAVRLWWLLRSTSKRTRNLGVATSFGLTAWALLAAAWLVDLARHSDLDGTLAAAMVVLVAALALTAVISVRSLLDQTQDARLAVLRSAGASRAQTTAVCTLEVLDSALPGIALGILAHLALTWAVAADGAAVLPTIQILFLPVVLLALATVTVVIWRVRSATRF